MYVLDTNFLALVNRDMPVEIAEHSGFWDVILGLARQDFLKIPEKVLEELDGGTDMLAGWIKANKSDLVLKTADMLNVFPTVLSEYQNGWAEPISFDDADFLEHIADPYVIGHALTLGAIVVTGEIPCKGGDYRQVSPRKRKVPDICNALKVKYMPNMKFLWEVSQTINKA